MTGEAEQWVDSEKLVRLGLLALSILSVPVPSLGASPKKQESALQGVWVCTSSHVVLSAEVNPPAAFLVWRVSQRSTQFSPPCRTNSSGDTTLVLHYIQGKAVFILYTCAAAAWADVVFILHFIGEFKIRYVAGHSVVHIWNFSNWEAAEKRSQGRKEGILLFIGLEM